jgi:hypothetical protein
MRIMQVRAWMHGQGWYDLRNYRLNPPFGANIHWSRLVDLPIAGLILGLRPFLGGAGAERWAVAIAPLLPYLLLLFSLALTTRRLLGPTAYLLAFLALFFAGSTNGMFMPERIDHHGWQLALLALGIAGIADPNKVRGGLTLGLSSALSLAIGLEMMIYLALAGVAMVLFWVDDRDEQQRLRAYAVSLGGATALSFLIFASNDNWGAVCDALSPVWLSDALVGGALTFVVGVVGTVAAVLTGSLVLLFVAAVVTGFAFGAAFFGAIAMVTDGVAPGHRAGLLAAVFVVGYLAFSLPAIAAGLAVPAIGLARATEIYGGVVIVLALVAVASVTLRARRSRRSAAAPAADSEPIAA